jgi:predicted nucleotidyltransferase
VTAYTAAVQHRAGELRERLIREAFGFARTASAVAGVRRVSLLGSILTAKPDPKDVDLLVRIAEDADLPRLAACARRLQGATQQFNRGADVFLADEGGRRYLGRTCPWKDCRPGVRLSCDALHCGARPHLHDDLRTIKLPAALVANPPLDLWPTIERRCELPEDVAWLLSEVWSPPAANA